MAQQRTFWISKGWRKCSDCDMHTFTVPRLMKSEPFQSCGKNKLTIAERQMWASEKWCVAAYQYQTKLLLSSRESVGALLPTTKAQATQ